MSTIKVLYKLRQIPQKTTEWYAHFLGLQHGTEDLYDIIDSCETMRKEEFMYKYIEHRLNLAQYYLDIWGNEVRKCFDKQDFGDDYIAAIAVKDMWKERVLVLSQMRNFLIEVMGVDRHGKFGNDADEDSGISQWS